MIEDQIKAADAENMKQLLTDFSKQWSEAMEFTKNLDLRVNKGRVGNVCLAGMGSSAIGAHLIQAYSRNSITVPAEVVRHYRIPGWLNEQTLFIACSFSGNTEETLAALQEARERGAQALAITSGGKLLLEATRNDFDYIKIPGGIPPRAALGYSFVPLFRIFQLLGFLDEGDAALSETRDLLADQAEIFTHPDENEPLNLARDITDTLPIVYSDAELLEPVNLRWREQFEENSKTLSYGNLLPEMNHNEIVGWERIAHLTGRLSVIMLEDSGDDRRVQKRMTILEDLIKDQTTSIHVLRSRGESRLSRMFSLVQLADWTSFYLAVINGIDPTPTARIDLFKSRLAEL